MTSIPSKKKSFEFDPFDNIFREFKDFENNSLEKKI